MSNDQLYEWQDDETTDNIKKLTAMTKLETEQKEEFANLLKQYPNLFAHNDNDSGHTTVCKT